MSRRHFLKRAIFAAAGGVLAGHPRGMDGAKTIRPVHHPCISAAMRGSRPNPKGRLVWLSAEAFAGGWDPTGHMVLANLHSEWNVFDRLFDLDPMTGEFVPALGLHYRIVQEGLECTLRPHVKFHSGELLTAADVKYTLERYSSPEVITGDYFPEPVQVEVVDDYACRVITNTPLPVLNLLTIVNIISHKDVPDTLAARPNGTGPFKFVKYENERITYQANMAYWKGPPRIEEFVMQYVDDPSTRLAALQKGEADIIDRVPPDHVSIIEGDPDLGMVTSQSTELTYLSWKVDRNQFTRNKLIRQAVAHCIDNKGIVNGIMGGYASVPDSIFARTIWPFGAPGGSAMPGYDLNAARRKLAEAGYPNGEGLPEFKAIGVVGFYPNMKEYMEYIIAQCARVGIRFRLEIKEAAAWLDSIYGAAADFEAYFAGWMNMSPEPDEFLLPYHRSNSLLTHIDDPAADRLLSIESTFTDLEARAKFMREEVVPYLADLSINAPIVHTLNVSGNRAQVKNYALLPNSCFTLWDTYIEDS